MTGRMIVSKIVDSLNRTESLYHGLRLSPDSSRNRACESTYLVSGLHGQVDYLRVRRDTGTGSDALSTDNLAHHAGIPPIGLRKMEIAYPIDHTWVYNDQYISRAGLSPLWRFGRVGLNKS